VALRLRTYGREFNETEQKFRHVSASGHCCKEKVKANSQKQFTMYSTLWMKIELQNWNRKTC